jgi:hypothetical protein
MEKGNAAMEPVADGDSHRGQQLREMSLLTPVEASAWRPFLIFLSQPREVFLPSRVDFGTIFLLESL